MAYVGLKSYMYVYDEYGSFVYNGYGLYCNIVT